MADILLGLGGNLGDPARTMDSALAALDARGVRVVARSALYRTPPWGVTDQPAFLNLCARAETERPPRTLLATIQMVERDLGRVRDRRWGPRTIDIDILAYDDLAVSEPGLTLPHPHLTERAFVLVPLCDVAPGWLIAGRSVAEWAADVDRSGIERIDPAPAEFRSRDT